MSLRVLPPHTSPASQLPLHAGGDLGPSLGTPRDAEEAEWSVQLRDLWAAAHAQPLDSIGRTRRGHQRGAELDALVVPSSEAWAWRIRPTWALH